MNQEEIRRELQAFPCQTSRGYAYISWAEGDWETAWPVLRSWLRQGYNLYVPDFESRAGDSNRVEQIRSAIGRRTCRMVICFRSLRHSFRYASLLELLTVRSDATLRRHLGVPVCVDVIRLEELPAQMTFLPEAHRLDCMVAFRQVRAEMGRAFDENSQRELEYLLHGLRGWLGGMNPSMREALGYGNLSAEDLLEDLGQACADGCEEYFSHLYNLISNWFASQNLNGNVLPRDTDMRQRFEQVGVERVREPLPQETASPSGLAADPEDSIGSLLAGDGPAGSLKDAAGTVPSAGAAPAPRPGTIPKGGSAMPKIISLEALLSSEKPETPGSTQGKSAQTWVNQDAVVRRKVEESASGPGEPGLPGFRNAAQTASSRQDFFREIASLLEEPVQEPRPEPRDLEDWSDPPEPMPKLSAETLTDFDSGKEAEEEARAAAWTLARVTQSANILPMGGFEADPDRISLAGDVLRSCRSRKEYLLLEPGVREIRRHAFRGNTTLEAIQLPEGLEHIGDGAFLKCENLSYISFPSSVRSIGARAFRGCKALREVVLPQNLEKLGKEAFLECDNLTKVFLPDSLETVGPNAFRLCLKLKDWNQPRALRVLPEGMFSFSGLEEVRVREGTREIGSFAFSFSHNLQTASLPDSLRKLGTYAFASCSRLHDLRLPEGLETIEWHTFEDCGSLAGVRIPGSVSVIGEGAFLRSGLRKIVLPDSVYVIRDGAFAKCERLAIVELPYFLRTIGREAFADCKSLRTIRIPRSATKIHRTAFRGCTSLVIEAYRGSAAATMPLPPGVKRVLLG